MAVNSAFKTSGLAATSAEQNLYADLIKEAIQIHGHDVNYIDRTLTARDDIFGEDSLSQFNKQQTIEMYVEDADGGYQGEKELIQQFGLENRNEITFVVHRTRFDDVAHQLDLETATATTQGSLLLESGTLAQHRFGIQSASFESAYLRNEDATLGTYNNRPKEGDLIFHPVLKKLFEVSFVDHDEPFHQLDNNPVYKLRCKQYEYSSEVLDTGIAEVDAIEDALSGDTLNHQTTLESGLYKALGTTSLTSNHPFAVDSVTITKAGEYTTAPTVTFSAPTGGGNETSIVQFGSRSYKSTGSAITVPTTGVSDLQHGSVGFWFYVSDNYSGIKTIVEFGANDNDTEKYSVSLQESGGTVQAFLKFPLNATSSGTGSSSLSTDLTTDEWHFLQLAQIDQAFNTRQIHLDNNSSFATASYKGNIIDDNGFIIDPDESLSDGDVFFDEFYATTVNSEITVPTATLSGQSGEVYFQGGERVTATGTAVLTGEEVTSVTITNAGSNYTSAPTITFADSDKVGSILLENSADSGDASYLIQEDYIVGDMSTDKTAQNEYFEEQDEDILDFSESNPFGDAGRT